MGQMGFFDVAKRYAGLDAKNDPLVKIDEAVPWEQKDCAVFIPVVLDRAWSVIQVDWQ